jgi:hypothetical protein
MQNSPIKCYLIPCICLEILCLTLWSLSGCNRQSNSKRPFFCRVRRKDVFFSNTSEVPWKYTYYLIKISNWLKKQSPSWKNSSVKSNVSLKKYWRLELFSATAFPVIIRNAW